MINILVVEDDKELNDLFYSVLVQAGYTVHKAMNGIQAFDILDVQKIDLIVTDVMMPSMDGFEFVEYIKENGYTMPILMITARDSLLDKRTGFKLGVDDYMVKPIDVNEMIWRVEALLRRSQININNVVKIKSTTFDKDTLSVSWNNTTIQLVQKEFMLLLKLVSSPNRIYTRSQIMDDIWGIDHESDSHTLDVHISRLRDKLKNNNDFSIVTIRGLGYKVVENNGDKNES